MRRKVKLVLQGAESPSQRVFWGRKGALETLRGRLDFVRDILTIRNRGADIPMKVNELGRYVLSVVAFVRGPPCVDRGPNMAA